MERFDPPHVLVHRSEEGSLTATGTWTFEVVDGDSTLVSQVAEFEVVLGFRPLRWAVEGLFSWMMHREADQALKDLVKVFIATK